MANYTNIRYGKLRLVGRFKTDRDDITVRDRCVIKTDRGKEIGEVLSPLVPIPETLPPESLWDIVRRASPDASPLGARRPPSAVCGWAAGCASPSAHERGHLKGGRSPGSSPRHSRRLRFVFR